MEINDNDKEINSAWHVHEDGTVHAHHGHTHTHTQTKAVNIVGKTPKIEI